MSTRQCEPTAIAIGERVPWTRSFSGYPADEYDLQYRFRGPGNGVNVDATVDGTAFVAEITAVQSATLSVGRYRWQAWLTEQADPDNEFIVQSGFLQVEAGFIEANTDETETRTAAEIALDTIDAALLAFATSDVTEYEISTPAGSRRVKRSDKVELTRLRSEYAKRVSVERVKRRVANGGPLMQSVSIVVREN